MSTFVAVLLMGLSGLPLALLLVGRRAEAVVLAPLLGAGYLALAACVEVGLGGSHAVLTTAALLLGFVLPPLVRRPDLTASAPLAHEVVLLAAPLLAVAATLPTWRRFEVGYDARSIWFFHARMLTGGQQTYLDRAHLFPDLHSDYPPLVPSAVSFSWRIAGSVDYRTGQLTVAVLVACATALAGLGVARALSARTWLAPLVALLGTAVPYGVWGTYASNGYADALSAALVLAGATYGLLGRLGGPTVALLALAAATKQEGLAFSVVVLIALGIASWFEDRRRFVLIGTCLALMVPWQLVVRLQDLGSAFKGVTPITGQSHLFRVGQTLEKLVPMLGLASLGMLGVVALCVVERRLRPAPFVLAWLGVFVGLLGIYALGPLEIHYWLASSLDRTSMTLRAGGLLAAVYAAGAAWQSLRGPGRPSAPTDRTAVGNGAPAATATAPHPGRRAEAPDQPSGGSSGP